MEEERVYLHQRTFMYHPDGTARIFEEDEPIPEGWYDSPGAAVNASLAAKPRLPEGPTADVKADNGDRDDNHRIRAAKNRGAK